MTTVKYSTDTIVLQSGTPRKYHIEIEADVENLRELTDRVWALSVALDTAGYVPVLDRSPSSQTVKGPAPTPQTPEEVLIPHCPEHGAMARSNWDQKDYFMFYCARKTDEGSYCNHKAKVHKETGETKFWRQDRKK